VYLIKDATTPYALFKAKQTEPPMQITCDNSLKMNRFSYSASKQYISECLVPRDTFQASSYIPLFGKVTTASVADIQPLSTQDRAFVASYFSEYASIFTQHVLPLSRYKLKL
jgi:hypothetical protein